MEELIQQMKVVLANMFAFYLEAHYFHWNVTGPDFPQLHDFFGNLYESVHDSVDDIAEHIRALNEYSPGTLERFKELTEIQEETTILKDRQMVAKLLIDNKKVIDSLNSAFKLAIKADAQGLANYLSERVDAHMKHQWMLRSIIS